MHSRDAAYADSFSVVCVSVGHTGELCKTGKPIEMRFGRHLRWAQGTTC